MDLHQGVHSVSPLIARHDLRPGDHLLQIAREVFNILPEDGPLVVIIDNLGGFWPSDSVRFSQLHISESWLKDFCSRIADGDEPALAQIDEVSVVGAALTTDSVHCGYVIIALPNYTPESTLANVDLIEIVLSQFSLIAQLIEKNNTLYQLRMKHLSPSLPMAPAYS